MSDSKHKIILVDDDDKLRGLLERFLEDQGFQVSTAADGNAFKRIYAREHSDLVILDRMLPDGDGLKLCTFLRESSHPPLILMLTARATDEERIHGLESGADDYLTKPFNPRELLARVRALLRRIPAQVPGAPSVELQSYAFSDIQVDLLKRSFKKNGVEIELSTGEFALLNALITHPYKTLSREQLMKLARDREFDPMARTIDTQVSRLRRLIEKDPSHPEYIQTVWGKGYVFVPDPKPE